MTSAEHDRRRLDTLLVHLAALELRLVRPHERAIHAVAHEALCQEIHALARRLGEGEYWRSSGAAASAAARVA